MGGLEYEGGFGWSIPRLDIIRSHARLVQNFQKIQEVREVREVWGGRSSGGLGG
jgi:hypothetical protein